MITSFIPNLLFLFVQISSETIETHRLGKFMTYIINMSAFIHSFKIPTSSIRMISQPGLFMLASPCLETDSADPRPS